MTSRQGERRGKEEKGAPAGELRWQGAHDGSSRSLAGAGACELVRSMGWVGVEVRSWSGDGGGGQWDRERETAAVREEMEVATLVAVRGI